MNKINKFKIWDKICKIKIKILMVHNCKIIFKKTCTKITIIFNNNNNY